MWPVERKDGEKVKKNKRLLEKGKGLTFMSSDSLEGEEKAWHRKPVWGKNIPENSKLGTRHKLTDSKSTANLKKCKLRETHTQIHNNLINAIN